MVFEPSGVADIYLASDVYTGDDGQDTQDAIAYTGTYTYTGGQLTLQFTSSDLQVQSTFALDTAQDTVTMPFMLFNSSQTGTSTWSRQAVRVEESLDVIFESASLGDEQGTDDALARVTNYANAVMALKSRPSAEKSALVNVSPLKNGVQIQYEGEAPVNVMLFSWANSAGTSLTMSALAGDPRVHLDPVSPQNPTADPQEKTALFIAPFKTRKSFAWYDYYWINKLTPIPSSQGYHLTGSEFFNFDSMQSLLQDHGYTVQQLLDDQATTVNIINALLPGKGGKLRSPGMVVFNTHGMSNGLLATGVYLGDDNGGTGYNTERDSIKAAGYGSLFTYAGGTEDEPKTVDIMCMARDMRPNKHSYYLSLTPKFWDWLHDQSADFSRSMVYIGSCLTDATSDLREAVKARAYFAFNVPAKPEVAGLIFQYFCKSLIKHSHSAEESYYNILRVANTRQMIYVEDKLFDGMITEGADAQHQVTQKVFNGYGYDGEEVISYQMAGWLKTPDADPGAIWWMLFAGRWGQDATAGAQGLKSCWDDYWSKGTTGGLASPGCQNQSPGHVPTQNELGYATYLLTGTPVVDLNAYQILRWTLNDGSGQ